MHLFLFSNNIMSMRQCFCIIRNTLYLKMWGYIKLSCVKMLSYPDLKKKIVIDKPHINDE